jgi:hypothetical protein
MTPATPPAPDSLTPCPCTGLQYSRDVTNWLSETHVRFGVGVSVDLQKRIGELHDLVRRRTEIFGAGGCLRFRFLVWGHALPFVSWGKLNHLGQLSLVHGLRVLPCGCSFGGHLSSRDVCACLLPVQVSDQQQLLGHLKHLAQAAAERQAGLQAHIDRWVAGHDALCAAMVDVPVSGLSEHVACKSRSWHLLGLRG